jgi:ligand-binding SRPBCC domain-containing protein
VHLLERTTLIKAPRADVFAFFQDAKNLAQITPPWLRLTIEAIDEPPMRKGFRIEHTLRWLVVRLQWDAVIVDYEPPRYFADEQVKGPYKYWRHVHTFEEVEGGTQMRDRVQYELPFGILGSVTNRLVVARQLRSIFDYRNRQIRKIFATGQRAVPAPRERTPPHPTPK